MANIPNPMIIPSHNSVHIIEDGEVKVFADWLAEQSAPAENEIPAPPVEELPEPPIVEAPVPDESEEETE